MVYDLRTLLAVLLLWYPTDTAEAGANARRGAVVFKQLKCAGCHATSGPGERTPLKFDRRLGFDYTPAGMASRMWNHAPQMWAAIRDAGLDVSGPSEAEAADLFAFFYARHFFENPGDPISGRRVFERKCARCHSGRAVGKAVTEWDLPGDSVALVQRLWNHAPEMRAALKAARRDWPQLSTQELTDLLVYVQNLSDNRSPVPPFSLPTGENGKALLQSKGCVACHNGFYALEGRLASRTLTGIAASMWNHAPAMREKAQILSLDEMREILAYIWSTDFFSSRGNVDAGRKVFSSRCTSCHTNPGSEAPDLKKGNRRYTAITMVWALWHHGRKMLQEVEVQRRSWPELSEGDMEDLIAFLDFRIRDRSRAAYVR